MINIAAIGTSMITTRFIDAVRMADGVTVTTIYSRDPARAATFAQEQGIPQTSSDLDELLASAAVDAVYVGSPNSAHREQVRRAIEAGKHVFVEKPAVPTAGEFAALCEQAATSGVVLFEGMRNVYDPGFDVVRELLPEVGAIRRVAFSVLSAIRAVRQGSRRGAGEHLRPGDGRRRPARPRRVFHRGDGQPLRGAGTRRGHVGADRQRRGRIGRRPAAVPRLRRRGGVLEDHSVRSPQRDPG